MAAKLIKSTVQYRLLNEDGIVIATSFYNGKLSLKNCEAIANGYDLDELAKNFANKHEKETDSAYEYGRDMYSFKAGCNAILELLGDKKFSEDDVNLAFVLGKNKDESRINKLINSRLQQTEWDVEIVEEQVYDGLDEMAQPQYYKQSKLDEKGQLILKKKLISS